MTERSDVISIRPDGNAPEPKEPQPRGPAQREPGKPYPVDEPADPNGPGSEPDYLPGDPPNPRPRFAR